MTPIERRKLNRGYPWVLAGIGRASIAEWLGVSLERFRRLLTQQQNECYSIYAAAVSRGDLVRPKNCSRCRRKPRKDERDLEGHHPDYRKPLEVIWLCKDCHAKEHNGTRHGNSVHNKYVHEDMLIVLRNSKNSTQQAAA